MNSLASFLPNLRGRKNPVFLVVGLGLLLAVQPGCIWKLWSKGKPLEERTFDVYGTVEKVTPSELVIRTKKGTETFLLADSSIKGSDFGPEAYVHVYYKIREDDKIVTMVVEKID